MKREILKNFFERYIQGTPEKAIVLDRKIFLCHLTNEVSNVLEIDGRAGGVYITSRCLKHLFDKKPAEEFMFLLDHLHEVAKYPDMIFCNKDGKRGGYCLVKKIGSAEYLCSIEVATDEIQIATAFRLRDEKYIKNYTLLWDWGNGNPHRSALDAP